MDDNNDSEVLMGDDPEYVEELSARLAAAIALLRRLRQALDGDVDYMSEAAEVAAFLGDDGGKEGGDGGDSSHDS
jgi:hypothetical protein